MLRGQLREEAQQADGHDDAAVHQDDGGGDGGDRGPLGVSGLIHTHGDGLHLVRLQRRGLLHHDVHGE